MDVIYSTFPLGGRNDDILKSRFLVPLLYTICMFSTFIPLIILFVSLALIRNWRHLRPVSGKVPYQVPIKIKKKGSVNGYIFSHLYN